MQDQPAAERGRCEQHDHDQDAPAPAALGPGHPDAPLPDAGIDPGRVARDQDGGRPGRSSGHAPLPHEVELGLERDARGVGDPALHLEHERADVGGGGTGLGLDEVGVLLRDDRAADPQALEPARVDEPAGGSRPAGCGTPSRRSRRRAGARAASARSRRCAPRTRAGSSAATAKLGADHDVVAVRARSGGSRAPRSPTERSHAERRRRRGRRPARRRSTSAVSRPWPPAFMRTAPPTDPGDADEELEAGRARRPPARRASTGQRDRAAGAHGADSADRDRAARTRPRAATRRPANPASATSRFEPGPTTSTGGRCAARRPSATAARSAVAPRRAPAPRAGPPTR